MRVESDNNGRTKPILKNRWEMFNGVEKLVIRKSCVIVSIINVTYIYMYVYITRVLVSKKSVYNT